MDTTTPSPEARSRVTPLRSLMGGTYVPRTQHERIPQKPVRDRSAPPDAEEPGPQAGPPAPAPDEPPAMGRETSDIPPLTAI